MDFSQEISFFEHDPLPESRMALAGYAALIRAFGLKVPAPDCLAAISQKHKKYRVDRWLVFGPRQRPENSLIGQLCFALKYEGINLSVLKALFDMLPGEKLAPFIIAEPKSGYGRRLWFLYEWLTGEQLRLEDAPSQNLVDLVDAKLQYPGPVRVSKRHRVRNNLPGVQKFCPMIRRTEKLENFINLNLEKRAQQTFKTLDKDLLMRAAAFLLLKDSKASYAIEGEAPSQNRAYCWGRAIGQAGIHPLSRSEFERLQSIMIGDFRFIAPGYRDMGGFIGVHNRANLPVPDHISARAEDLDELMEGLIETDTLLKDDLFHPVLAATVIAFGFVFIHPLEDGNGRLHRYLLHHVLLEKNFSPKGIVFPVSAILLEKIEDYRKVLESYSTPRLPFIQWRPTRNGNVEVLNDTRDLYRYFDATAQAEFLYSCIQETIEKTLPEELDFLKKYDALWQFISQYIEMPDKMIDLLIRFLHQNNGSFSKRALQKEFSLLSSEEITTLEAKYKEIFS